MPRCARGRVRGCRGIRLRDGSRYGRAWCDDCDSGAQRDGTFAPELLDALRSQEWAGELEILAYDSESDDGSWEWLSAQRDVVSDRVNRRDFSHGRTRQAMAELARHEFVAFLTQDAVPASHLWLAELVRPFTLSAEIAAVVGRQTPRPDAPAVVKRDIVISFANLGNPLGISIYQNGPTVDAVFGRQPLSFISDVNAAYRREVLVGPVPFPPVEYSEDQAIARKLLDAGHAIAYSPFAEVIHSNDITLENFRARIDDETAGLRDWLGVQPPQERVVGRGLAKASVRGIGFALRDTSRSRGGRLKDALAVPAFEVRRRQAWRDVRERSGR